MSRAKVHPLLKNLTTKLSGKTSVLILGPLPVQQERLQAICKKTKPEVVLYVDGGLIHKKKFLINKKIVHLSLGDGDSSLAPELLLPAEKDFSDLAFGLSGLTDKALSKVALLGFSNETEKRPDHLIQNLGEVYKFVERRKLALSMDQFLFFPAGKNEFFYRGTFSLFAFAKTAIRLTGKARYQIPEWKMLEPFSSLGLSNIGNGKIYLENKKTVMVYRAGENII